MSPPAPASHRVTADAAGAPLLVKRVSDAGGRARLAAEAATLAALAHPGMVRVRSHSDDGAVAELALEWVGPHSLATVTGLAPAGAAAIVAGVADTVADLHGLGIVHQRLTPDHVLLGPGKRPVLTGCADATGGDRRATADDVVALGALLTTLVAPADDGPIIPDRRPRRRGDAGLRGALLTLADLARADDPEVRPSAAELASLLRTAAPTGRRHRRRAGRVAAPAERPAVTTGPADAAPAMGPDGPVTGPSRPSTTTTTTTPPPNELQPRAFAVPSGPDRPATAPVPASHPNGTDEPPPTRRATGSSPPSTGRGPAGVIGRPPPSHRGHRSRRSRRTARRAPRRGTVAAVVALAVAVAATGAAVAWVVPDDDPNPSADRPAPTTTAPRAATPSTAASAPTSSPEVGAPEPDPEAPPSPSPAPTVPPAPADGRRCAPVAGPAAADVDGDGCPDPVLIDAERITVGDTTWVVGRPGDTLAVGDWDCDGTATAAVLRPSTGEVFVFDRWIASGDELTVAAAAIVDGGTAVVARDDDGDGCAELAVTRAGGPAVPVGAP